MANLELPFGIKVLNPTSLDAKYLNDGVPYADVTEVNSLIVAGIRHTGLTVNIIGVEYWYANGVTDSDLVIKSGGGTGSGERIEKAYTQATHGFSVGEVVAWSGTSFIKAIADGSQDGAEVVGFITEVADVNNFTAVFSGYIEGISGLTLSGGSTYFLSTTVAGGITVNDTETLGTISKPILTTFTNDDALVFQYRGFEVDSGATTAGKEVIVTTIATYEVLETNVDTLFISSGTTTYNLPASPLDGAEVVFVDGAGTAGTTPITLDGGVITIYDEVSTTAIIGTDYGSITLVFNGIFWNVTAFV
jgi:hypothetical protein